MENTSKYQFFCSCVCWDRDDVDSLHNMIERNTDITRRTFLQYVDRVELAAIEAQMGYSFHPSQGLTMAADWAVSYHRSKLHGKRVYYFRHSAIEYVFTV